MARVRVGDVVGSYRIVGQLGAGGMGAVFLGRHTLIGREAAIKVLLPQFVGQPGIVQRFFNEAKAMSSIDHPGIVEVFDFGHADDGSAFLVMERLEGETLGERLRRDRKLRAGQAVWIARQVASALGAAHRLGIVHRDLKPDNVFLVPDPELTTGERAKILDFGIAKLRDGGGGFETQAGALMGAPLYMAPEQCQGSRDVDPRADLYSLGCILFEMLCGRAPILGRTYAEVLAGQVERAPPRPRSIDPGIAPALEELVLRLLEKSPTRRPRGADEVAAELERLGAGGAAVAAVAATMPSPFDTAIPADEERPLYEVRRRGGGDRVMVTTGSERRLEGAPAPAPEPSAARERRVSAPPPIPRPPAIPSASPRAARPSAPPLRVPAPPRSPRREPVSSHPPLVAPPPAPRPTPVSSLPPSAAVAPGFAAPPVRPYERPPTAAHRPSRGGLVVVAFALFGGSAAAYFIATSGDLEDDAIAALVPERPSPDPTPSASSTPTPSASPTPTPSASPTPTPTPTSAPTSSATPSPPPTPTSSPTPSPMTTPTPTETPPPLDPRDDETNRRPVALVTLRIDSLPHGAVVVRRADGVRLGETPYVYEIEPQPGTVTLVLRHEGYASEVVTLPSNRSVDRVVSLTRSRGADRAPSLED